MIVRVVMGEMVVTPTRRHRVPGRRRLGGGPGGRRSLRRGPRGNPRRHGLRLRRHGLRLRRDSLRLRRNSLRLRRDSQRLRRDSLRLRRHGQRLRRDSLRRRRRLGGRRGPRFELRDELLDDIVTDPERLLELGGDLCGRRIRPRCRWLRAGG